MDAYAWCNDQWLDGVSLIESRGSDLMKSAADVQRAYYAETAQKYDEIHKHERDEHGLALAYMTAMIDFFGIQSVLDVGSGTGFALLKLKEKMPHIRAVGVEPSPAQRAVGYGKGLSEAELIEGDARALAFPNGAFDLVCEFGALHHMPHPELAISEMLRVAGKAVFICDNNNFGQGRKSARLIKQAINSLKLWKMAVFIKTKGRGYMFSSGDGVMYSFSIFNHYKQISRKCSKIHLMNLASNGPNPYREAANIALYGIIK